MSESGEREERIELNLSIARGILAHEGLELSEETERIVRAELEGRITQEQAVNILLKGVKDRGCGTST